mmetsp:Transcript_23228/g.72542  ORF Transcript_23228/g.72542 Transcript_23228/m.72542 type:complete len:132 (-) Transcript_23228:58-453(-)
MQTLEVSSGASRGGLSLTAHPSFPRLPLSGVAEWQPQAIADRIEAACAMLATSKEQYKKLMDGAFKKLVAVASPKPSPEPEPAPDGPDPKPTSGQTKISHYFSPGKTPPPPGPKQTRIEKYMSAGAGDDRH